MEQLRRLVRLVIASAAAVVLAAASAPAVPAATACADLVLLTIPGVKIASSTAVQAGAFTPPGATSPLTLPAFCRVAVVATPTADSVINVEVWIPPAEAWNGKFQGVGNSGWTGAIAYGSLANALRRGYATASTDGGHTGDDLIFAAGHPEKIVDWAYRAVHLMTDTGKRLVSARQGRSPQHSYFTGCSTAGAQGLMEAQRFPDDYDGIVAGNPGNDRTNRLVGYLWSWMAAHQEPGSQIPPAKLAAVNKAVLAACDALDGVTDGVLDDPRRCRFDPATLICRGADDGTCLTTAQLTALNKIYDGPRNPRTGEQIFPGVPRGSESGNNNGWQTYIMDSPEPQRVGFWKYFLFNDPKWDFHAFDWDRDVAAARSRMGPIVNAANPDLRPFKTRGGKIVMSAGWNDPIHLSEAALNYYTDVQKTMGGPDKTRDFFRLFMVPGMGHCAPGPGPSTFDALSALEGWVERGVAPETITASRMTNGAADRTRPLCPHPQVARWNSTGSTDDATNFSCVNP